MITKRKICVVTGTRAEYGLLRWVIDGIKNSLKLELQLVVTGMHLSPEFGLTIKEILNDGYRVDKKVEMLLSSDSSVGICKSIGLGVIGFADALNELEPDILILLGDRFEILSAAIGGMSSRIPIAHIHGGESTEGVIDESIRHSITKLSHVHFVAHDLYRKRIIQLGEQPEKVFNFGGLGIDNINNLELLSKPDLEKSINFKFGDKNLLVTFHPATLEKGTCSKQMDELLEAIASQKQTNVIFTLPNSDNEGRILFSKIRNFCEKDKSKYSFYTSLGQLNYLSCLKYVDGVVGNSSSGLLEAPSFRIGTINIGDRQKGRLYADSVINCKSDKNSIKNAINHLFSKEFREVLKNVKNPYGEGGASLKIVSKLENLDLKNLLKKNFFNIDFSL